MIDNHNTTIAPVAELDAGVEKYYKNFLGSLLGADVSDDELAADLEHQIYGWERDGEALNEATGYPWQKVVELLRAALAALRAGKLDRAIEETRAQWLERRAREKRREASNLAILRAALG